MWILESLKPFCLSLFFFFLSQSSYCQYNQWTWVKGSNTTNMPSVQGAIGVPAPGDTPGAEYEPAEWTDTQGNYWIYGGESGMWKYDPHPSNPGYKIGRAHV